MRKYLPILLCSFLSAFLAVIAFKFFFPTQIIIEEENVARKVTHDMLFSDRMNMSFSASQPNNFIKAANESVEAVVFISSLKDKSQRDKFTRRFNSSTGSGVIISNDGYIVTNEHVIKDAEIIEVLTNDNKEFVARLIGKDPTTDLALLKIEGDQMPFLVFGNSDSLQIGEWVMAIGNPFRLQSTVTAGIVSAKARSINILSQQGIESFIQTDAAVNPGNSGGALVNTTGELVGIITAIISYSGKYEGFSFAIPANLARKVIYDIKEYGAVQRGWLGVTISKVDDKIAKMYKMKRVEGVYVDLVNKESAAYDAGLKSGDILLKVNNKKTNTVSQFMEKVSEFRPGDIVDIEYIQKGVLKKAKATLRNQLNTTDFIAVRKDKILTDLGFEIRDLDSKEQQR